LSRGFQRYGRSHGEYNVDNEPKSEPSNARDTKEVTLEGKFG